MLKPRIEWILLQLKEEGKLINQKTIAKELGVSNQQVSAWVNGKAYPRAEKLFQLARLLNCKVDDLYELE